MFVRGLLAALSVLAASPASSQLYEPKEVKAAKDIKPGDGIVRLSLRTQRQFIETAYLYFIEVLPDGSDGARTLQFERGAGVPIMGTNMIDVKSKYYRVPKGKYRLLAYTVACAGVPPPGATCNFRGAMMPTERYAAGSPAFDVIEGGVTDAGDFVIEYVKDVDLDNFSLFKDRFSDEGYGVRWRPIKDPLRADLNALAAGPKPDVPPFFRSRIECDRRPKDRLIQFPFRCPA